MTTSTTDAEAIREAFAKVVVEADRDWNGNVAGYRKYLVDRLTDCGLFVLASRREAQEPVAWLRDLDGTGSLHPASEGDPGAFAVYRVAPSAPAGEVERLRGALQYIAKSSGERTVRDMARAALNVGRAGD